MMAVRLLSEPLPPTWAHWTCLGDPPGSARDPGLLATPRHPSYPREHCQAHTGQPVPGASPGHLPAKALGLFSSLCSQGLRRIYVPTWGDVFTVLSLLMHKQGASLLSFRYSLISLSKSL